MHFYHKKTHKDQIWSYESIEVSTVQTIGKTLIDQGFTGGPSNGNNFGYPIIYHRNATTVTSRLVDSVFFNLQPSDYVITDNIPLDYTGQVISVIPEFWHMYHFTPEYQHQEPRWGYNCFMNRISGDRLQTFYELIKRNILEKGLVSFNCFRPGDNRLATDTTDYSITNYNWQYKSASLERYYQEHQLGQQLVPYNNITDSIEQSIINSKISLVLETYISDSHITFSEKLFRALQMPRPWLLYCSPESIKYLRHYGFDVLDDYVDHSYDQITMHNERLLTILDQLETCITKQYTETDYQRFNLAAQHNQQLLLSFRERWPEKLNTILEEIKKL